MALSIFFKKNQTNNLWQFIGEYKNTVYAFPQWYYYQTFIQKNLKKSLHLYMFIYFFNSCSNNEKNHTGSSVLFHLVNSITAYFCLKTLEYVTCARATLKNQFIWLQKHHYLTEIHSKTSQQTARFEAKMACYFRQHTAGPWHIRGKIHT